VIAPAWRRLLVKGDLLLAVGLRDGRTLRRVNSRLPELRANRVGVYNELWSDAERELGADLRDLGSGVLELRSAAGVRRIREEVVQLDDPQAAERSFDKPLVHGLLRRAHVPVPDHLEVSPREGRAASAFLDGGPCVVKPARGTGVGAGVTGGVETPRQLRRAVLGAAAWGGGALLERQIEGGVYRLLFLDGELLDVIRRRPPHVTGDGRASISGLISAENLRRLEARGRAGLWFLRVDYDSLFELARAGMSPKSVPSRGDFVVVKTATSQNSSEENDTVRAGISPQLVAECAVAAEAVGLRLAGIDVVAPALDRPLSESGGAVIEVNAQPGLHHHYLVADPEGATPVAVPILRALLR
jgi:hypothetical protein